MSATLSSTTITAKDNKITIGDTDYSIPSVPGETLPNSKGAILIAESITDIPSGASTDPAGPVTYITVRESVVLAICPGAVDSYVTWLRRVGVGDHRGDLRIEEMCLWGHYYSDLDMAVEDFNTRSGRTTD